MTIAQTIINWAASQSNGHGEEVVALSSVINSDRVSEENKEILRDKMAEWNPC